MAKVQIISLHLIQVLEYSLLLIPILPSHKAQTSVDPNVFFTNDDTPPGHRIGRITHFDGHQNVPFTSGNSVKAILVRGHQPPATYFTLDEIRGDLFTKILLDRETLCPTNGNMRGENALTEGISISGHKHNAGQMEQLSGHGTSRRECELSMQVALHRTTTDSRKTLPEFLDIRVVIMDRNDHLPTFHPHKSVNISVAESVPVGTRLKLPLAIDLDTLEFNIQRYQLSPNDQPEWVMQQQAVDIVSSGKLYQEIVALSLELRSPLDREKKDNYFFEVRAYDSSPEAVLNYGDRNVLKVYLSVKDTNDNGPVFLPQLSEGNPKLRIPNPHDFHFPVYTADVIEATWPKSPLVVLKATDGDSFPYSVIRYDFAPYVEPNVKRYFKISDLTGDVFLRQPLDYEKQSSYAFDVLAIDSEYERRSKFNGRVTGSSIDASIYTATARLVVNVKDVNDEGPIIVFDYLSVDPSSGRPSSFASIEENLEPPQFVADILVTDKDANPKNSHVSCHIDQEHRSHQGTMGQHIFDDKMVAFDFQLSEVRRQPGRVQYNLLTSKPLDREEINSGASIRRIMVTCADSGIPIKSDQLTVIVQVTDVNDNNPILKLQKTIHHRISQTTTILDNSLKVNTVYLYENTSPGTLLARINVTDPDYGDNGKVTCYFVTPMNAISTGLMSYFHIDPNTCEVVTQKPIDRESTNPPIEQIDLYIEARDHGTPSNTGSLQLTVRLLDENDNPPQMPHTLYRLSVRENLPVGTWVGTFVITDLDGHCDELAVRFLKHENLPFQLWTAKSAKTSNATTRYSNDQTVSYYLNTTQVLDREVHSIYEFKMVVIDAPKKSLSFAHLHAPTNRHTTTVTVVVEVEDENDNDPVIIFPQQANKTFVISSTERSPYQLMTINVNDKDTANGNFFFTLIYESVTRQQQVTNLKSNDREGNVDNSISPSQNEASAVTLDKSGSFLEIDRGMGTIYLSRDMTKTDEGLHAFHVVVQDTDSPPRSASLRFLISVEPISPRLMLNKTPQNILIVSNDSPANNGEFQTIPAQQEDSPKSNYKDREVDFSLQSTDSMQSLEQPLSQSRLYLPRLTGDVVLILSLGLILLLLLATLCLVIYIRHWSNPTGSRNQPPKSDIRSNRLYTACCQRNIHDTEECVTDDKVGMDNVTVGNRTRIWSPIPSTNSGHHHIENIDRCDARHSIQNSPDDSTNTTMLHRLCNEDRVYYHDFRPFSVVPIYPISPPNDRTVDTSTFGRSTAAQVTSPYSVDYTALQSHETCDCCTGPAGFEECCIGKSQMTDSSKSNLIANNGERSRSSMDVIGKQRQEFNSNYTPLDHSTGRSPVFVSSELQLLNKTVKSSSLEGLAEDCIKLSRKPPLL